VHGCDIKYVLPHAKSQEYVTFESYYRIMAIQKIIINKFWEDNKIDITWSTLVYGFTVSLYLILALQWSYCLFKDAKKKMDFNVLKN
jgi:hypothetical protein